MVNTNNRILQERMDVVGHSRGERESFTSYAKKNNLRPLLKAIEAIDCDPFPVVSTGLADGWMRFVPFFSEINKTHFSLLGG